MKTVTSADGTEIAFERTGSGPPLVFVHGGIGDHRFWDLSGVRPALAEHCTVYAMDRRGCGESEAPDSFAKEREAEDVAAVADTIDEPVILLGHSGGGTPTLEAALRIDDLRTLILYEPAFQVSADALDADAEIAEMMNLLKEGKNEQALVLSLEDFAGLTPGELDRVRAAPTWEEEVETFAETLFPQMEAADEWEFDSERFGDVTTPTLLLSGTESGHWLRETIETLDDTLPNSRIVTFDGHGHLAMLTAPDRFTDEVLSFIRESY